MSFVSAPKLTTSAWAGWLAWGLSGREEAGFFLTGKSSAQTFPVCMYVCVYVCMHACMHAFAPFIHSFIHRSIEQIFNKRMVPFVDREQLRFFLFLLLFFLFFSYRVKLFLLLLTVTQDSLFSCTCSAV